MLILGGPIGSRVVRCVSWVLICRGVRIIRTILTLFVMMVVIIVNVICACLFLCAMLVWVCIVI